ncbi:MAG TPA: HU family DNA-binding protein [Candidatus Hydrogenedentes bacterium]|nr:HU family DNA-binding protein [Candidatus Hydrogenedentota bacterium]
MTVTKRELTLRIAGKLGMPPQDAARIVEALIETLAGRLLQGERWEFRGFGVFEVRERVRWSLFPPVGRWCFIPVNS